MFSECISSWPVCSGYASFPDAYAQHFLKGIRSVHTLVANTYAQCTHQFLTRMLSVRISSWRACSVHASVPYAHAEGIQNCAAEAIFYCPTMNSHRPKSQVTSKEPALNPEKELRRTWARCHVSLEKSSKNHKPLEKWAKPNLSPDVTPRPANFYGEYFPRVCCVVKPDPPELSAVLTRHSGWQK